MRYRWIHAEWPYSMTTMAKRMRERSFRVDSSNGFILDRTRDNFIEARFVERYEVNESSEDPFGETIETARIEYKQTSFRATQGWPGLELIGPPRSVTTLINQLQEISNFSLAISSLNVDVMKWVLSIQSSLNAPMTFQSFQLGNLILQDGVTAKVLLKGKNRLREASDDLTKGRSHRLEKLECSLSLDDHITTLLLSHNGTIKITGDAGNERLLKAIRDGLLLAPVK